MKIKNPKLIRECRKSGLCDYCKKPCKKREGAHVISRGAGGSDLKCNLVCLGSTKDWCCPCHSNSHAGHAPDRMDLLRIVALREKCTTDDVLLVIDFFRRLDKHASKYRIVEELLKLPNASKAIAERELTEAGVLT